MNRRQWLKAGLRRGLGIGAFLGVVAPRRVGARDHAMPIVQPEAATPEEWTARALAMRERAVDEGDQPYGAVVVRGGLIVGEAPSRVVTAGDPTAHAEMEAIRDAARRLGTRHLAGCVLYASSRPCPMCEAAAYWAGIEGMVHGSAESVAVSPRLSRC